MQDAELLNGFRMGPITVHPLEGRISGPDGESHLQPLDMDVLVYLARHQGEVAERSRILDEVWRGRIVNDESLNRCISELRQALGDRFDQPTYIKTIHRRGYQLLVPVTPLEKDAPPRKPPVAVIVAAVALIAIVAILVKWFEGVSPPDRRSVAVVRFCNIGGDPANQYFTDGIADDILDVLASFDSLRVPARSSSFRFDCGQTDARDIARQLEVDHIVEGSVRRADEQIKVSVNLVDDQGYSLWRASYEGRGEAIFGIAKDVSRAVLQQLDLTASGSTPLTVSLPQPESLRAYDLYKKGRYAMAQRTPEGIADALEWFELAIEADERYALGYVGAADALALQMTYGNLSDGEALRRMQPYVERAMALAPNAPEVLTTRGSMLEIQGDYAGAQAAYEAAIAARPNHALAHMWLGHLLLLQNKANEALPYYKKAYSLDRLNFVAIANLAKAYFSMGRYDEGLQLVEEARATAPDEYLVHFTDALWSLRYGDFAEALRAARRAADIDPDSPMAHALVSRASQFAGDEDAAFEALATAARLGPNNWMVIDRTAESALAAGRYAAMDETLQVKLAAIDADPSAKGTRIHKSVLNWSAVAKLMSGDAAAAVALFERADRDAGAPSLDADEEAFFLSQRVLALRNAGRAAEAGRRLDEAEALVATIRQRGFYVPALEAREAGILALRGDADAAIARLAAARDRGFRMRALIENDLVWRDSVPPDELQRALASMDTEGD